MTYCQSITQTLRIIWAICIPLSLRSKTRLRATPLLPTWIHSCRSRVTVSCALPITTNATISTSSNIPSSPSYGVLISQLIRYVRACFSYECFILRAARLSSKLLGQRYVMERLKSSSGSFMVDMGVSSNIMKYPFPKCYMTFLDMTMYNDTLN